MTPFLQISQSIATTASSWQESSFSLWDLATKGGWIMIVLLLLSVVAIYIFVYKLIEIRKASRKDDSFMDRIRDYLQMDRVDSALSLCKQKNTPEARMIEKGLKKMDRPYQEILLAIENVGNVEIGRLERRMPLLATISAAAPMIGFLGTVTGMVRAFFNLSQSTSGVDISLLSSGIYEALVTTIGGLVVGIVTLFAYNYLVSLIDNVVNRLESRTLEFMDVINE